MKYIIDLERINSLTVSKMDEEEDRIHHYSISKSIIRDMITIYLRGVKNESYEDAILTLTFNKILIPLRDLKLDDILKED